MLTIVIAKPIELPMVSADPTHSRGAFFALSAESCGESPTTTMPQKTRNARNTGVGAWKRSGDSAQNNPDEASCANATGALPARSEISPPPVQPTLPAAMTTNAQNETLTLALSPC